jgi:hypothetical protein
MQTHYAYGRNLSAPTITVENSGSISGGGNTYYFWLKARNRVGHSNVSPVTSLVVDNGKRLKIAATNFSTFIYEGWVNYIVTVSRTNDFTTSRVIYKQELFSNQITPITITDTYITTDFLLNGNAGSVEVADISSVPSVAVNGFRIFITSTQRVYEFLQNGNLPIDNVTILPGTNGQWVAVPSNSYTELDVNYNKQLFQVTDSELIEAPLLSAIQFPVGIKYYIVNDEGTGLTQAELDLNSYISDASIKPTYNVQVLGYLNLSSFALDTTGIDYLNTIVVYPNTKIQLNKTLPNNSALVIEVTPNLTLDSTIIKGTYITLYPKLNKYTISDIVSFHGEPSEDIASLKALPSSVYKDKQVRYVKSKQAFYAFDINSALADNGDTVLIPAGNPATGRWLQNNTNVLPGSITPEMLSNSTLALINSGIETTTVTLSLSTNYVINLDNITTDYLVLNTQPNDGNPTVINVTATMANNTTKAILLELRQNTGDVNFHNSIIFPGGSLPAFSGNGKIDLFVVTLVKDGAGVLKKRAVLVQKDIG